MGLNGDGGLLWWTRAGGLLVSGVLLLVVLLVFLFWPVGSVWSLGGGPPGCCLRVVCLSDPFWPACFCLLMAGCCSSRSPCLVTADFWQRADCFRVKWV
ncbi:hypothetical protein FPQ18DRAFT_1686 [Pyronema domesticum]|nr:hypothetical protein FPQ18DRAFT_1686 [Pyronema domesticum]